MVFVRDRAPAFASVSGPPLVHERDYRTFPRGNTGAGVGTKTPSRQCFPWTGREAQDMRPRMDAAHPLLK